MSETLAIVLVVVIFGLTLSGLPWLSSRVRRRGISGGYSIMGPFEEIWHPIALVAHVEIQAQDERRAPAPLPGNPLT
ncbi:MAG: hypothetical protein ABI382_13215 [Nakamurella sp.]